MKCRINKSINLVYRKEGNYYLSTNSDSPYGKVGKLTY